jgi:predicted RNA-binding protein (virulence factor B family)
MIEVGYYQRLRAGRQSPPGVYLTDGDGEVLLPNRLIPEGLKLGDEVEVFVYTDSEDRPVATTQKPKAAVGGFALMAVVDVTRQGAFLNWGLDKDLFVPFALQRVRMQKGDEYVIAVCFDPRTKRVMGSSKIDTLLDLSTEGIELGQKVELLVFHLSDLGAQVVVDQRYCGLVYASATYQPLKLGDTVPGYVRRIREDGKLDVGLKPAGPEALEVDAVALLAALDAAGGTLKLHDKSSPQAIAQALQMSKKAFKRALGSLYRKRLVTLGAEGIRRLPPVQGAK